MKKYKVIRIDFEVWKNFEIRQNKLASIYKELTGKNKKIPIIKVIKLASKIPMYLGDEEVVKLFRKNKV